MTQGYEHTLGERFEVGGMVGGKYHLLRKAGEGAMGSVWVAANTALDANVAIKVLRPEMRSPAIAERLLWEARAAAKLSHPGIVRVFDLGKTECGTPYIVMELLEGEALRDVLCRQQRLSPEAALAILLPVASAMHAAHERGIVHRDLKPDNVMLAEQSDGAIQPKVVDFGIAKVTWTEPESGSTGAAVIGTPQYMPPEQALGQSRIDHRADIWALCTTLYEAIAGETPYAGEQGLGTLRAIIQDPVPSLVDRCGVDPALWAIIDRGLRKDPAERWGSMRELGVALAMWLLARGVSEDVCGSSIRAQWLDERASPVPTPSPRPMMVSAAPTLHSRRADEPPEQRSPFASERSAPAEATRRQMEESGERAWSEATVAVNLRGASEPAQRPSLHQRFSLRRAAAAGFVLMAGAAAWSVAPSAGVGDAPLSPAQVAPAAPAAAPLPGTPRPEAPRPPAEASSLTTSMARGVVVPLPAASPSPAAPARASKAAPTAAPAAIKQPVRAPAALPELPAADAGVEGAEAPAVPAPKIAAGGLLAPDGEPPCSAAGLDGDTAACPPPADASTNPLQEEAAGALDGASVQGDDAGAASPAPEEPPPAPEKDAPANDAPTAEAPGPEAP
ncbi:serine/threonine-protein kinase [Sorangium sp. So ce854]|uniref:serine/threonine-protein kinase n=1 Tax=Sorangium sp. So ce854 TaxID=3133322 RepID=UPI003F5EA70E